MVARHIENDALIIQEDENIQEDKTAFFTLSQKLKSWFTIYETQTSVCRFKLSPVNILVLHGDLCFTKLRLVAPHKLVKPLKLDKYLHPVTAWCKCCLLLVD